MPEWPPFSPLSAWLLAALMKAIASELIVLKAAVSIIFAGVVLLAMRLSHQLGSPRLTSPFLLAALLAFASPGTVAVIGLYSHLANFFFCWRGP